MQSFVVTAYPVAPPDPENRVAAETDLWGRTRNVLLGLPDRAILECRVMLVPGTAAVEFSLTGTEAPSPLFDPWRGVVEWEAGTLPADSAPHSVRLLPHTSAGRTDIRQWPESGPDLQAMLELANYVQEELTLSFWFTRLGSQLPIGMLNRRLNRMANRGIAESDVDRLREAGNSNTELIQFDLFASYVEESDLQHARRFTFAGAHLAQESLSLNLPASPLSMFTSGRAVALDAAVSLVPLAYIDATSPAPVGRRTPLMGEHTPARPGHLSIGTLLGTDLAAGVPSEDVYQHVLLTGLSGFGKSTTSMSILHELWMQHTPFLVIDPIKSDYLKLMAQLADSGVDVAVLELGHPTTPPINPLSVPDGVEPLAFASTLAELLIATSELDVFPLASSALRTVMNDLFARWIVDERLGSPTMAELYRAIRAHLSTSPMTSRAAAEVETSLLTRIEATLAGPAGQSLAGGPMAGIDWEALTSKPTLITLRHLGDVRARQNVFSMLMAGLTAFRLARPAACGHFTVLEEAHLLFPNGGEVEGAAAQIVATSLTTMRAFHEGFMLITQTPKQIPAQVRESVSTRITHRLPGESAAVAALAGGQESIGPTLVDLPHRVAAVWTASGGPRASFIEISKRIHDDVPSPVRALSGAAVVRRVGAPQPIWCSKCPSPCHAGPAEAVAPRVLSELGREDVGRPQQSVTDLARRAADLSQLAATDRFRMTNPDRIATFVYCTVARALTALFAKDAYRAQAVTEQAANEADRVRTMLGGRP